MASVLDTPCNMAKCYTCEFTGEVTEFISDTDSEGWEYPSYTIHLCPKCGETVEEYYYSPEVAATLDLP